MTEERGEWSDWNEDTQVEVLRRYLATFGEPTPQRRELPTDGYIYRGGEMADDDMGHPHEAPDPSRPRWLSAPKEPDELELERVSLGLKCLVSYAHHGHGRYRADRTPFRRRWRGSRESLAPPPGPG